MKYRVGQGFDLHPLEKGRKLILGGVEIAHESGLRGHSDADAAAHALANAILGAIGEGDLGRISTTAIRGTRTPTASRCSPKSASSPALADGSS